MKSYRRGLTQLTVCSIAEKTHFPSHLSAPVTEYCGTQLGWKKPQNIIHAATASHSNPFAKKNAKLISVACRSQLGKFAPSL